MLATDPSQPTSFVVSEAAKGLSVTGRLEGVSGTAAAKADGYQIWSDALGTNAHVLRRYQDDGFEDFASFEVAPPSPELTYTITVDRHVAGLRLVADTLEFLDDSGTPRLRVARPSILSADGTEHEGHLAIEGCAVDTNPAPPWGRPVVAPGAAECTLRVEWDASAVTYPALVDPQWVTTASMIGARSHHTATVLTSGRVLVTGGSALGASLQTAEIYDPTTRTWAAAAPMGSARADHSAHTLTGDRVLAVGGTGASSELATSEIYTESTGLWTPAGSLGAARALHASTTLSDGRVMVVGGASGGGSNVLASAEIFDPTTSAWTSTPPMSLARVGSQAITLADGRVLVPGGRTSAGAGCTAAAEVYTPSANSWSSTASLAAPRCDYSGRRLPDGTVLIAAGYSDDATLAPTDAVELYNPPTGVWRTSALRAPFPARMAASSLYADGGMYLTGGLDAASLPVSTGAIYSLSTTSSWHPIGHLPAARAWHTATPLGTARILLAGGIDTAGDSVNDAQLFDRSPRERADTASRRIAIRMSWQNPTMVSPFTNGPQGVLFRNDTGTSVPGVLRIVAWTPDGRTVAKNLRTITIPPCREVTGAPCVPQTLTAGAAADDALAAPMGAVVGQNWLETITPPDIPSQPTAHEGVFHVEFIPNGGDDAFRLATTNIYYQFAPGYTAVRFNGERGADSLLNEVNYATPDDYFAALSPHLTDLEQPTTGRILLADGTWQDMQFGVPKGPEYEVVGGYRLGGPFGFGRPAFGPREDLEAVFYPPKAIDWHFVPTELTGSRKVCAAIEPDFRDGNRGETYGNSAIPASFMKASLFGSGLTILLPNGKVKRESIWTGWLDADGCTPELAIVKGKYSLVVTSSMHRVAADGFHSTDVAIQQKNAVGSMEPVSWALSFQTLVWVLEGTSPGLNVRITGGLAGNAAATASRLLRMDQEGIKPASYTIRLHDVPDGCVTQGQKVGALLNTNGIDICPNDGAPANENNAYYKFVIAHELGHYVERESDGTIPSPPDWTNPYAVSDSGANIPLGCNCSFVVPAGNRLHCLQSQEVYSMGSVEGFGQFFATRMWNDPAAAAPRFQYYKHFREPTGTVLPPGGKIVNVRQTPIKWSDTYCPATADGRSTEYDFLGFYWSINTAPSAERTPLDHLFAIMQLVEDNPSDVRVWNGTSVSNAGSWAIYDKAARDHYGAGDPRYMRFRDNGPTYGVDH